MKSMRIAVAFLLPVFLFAQRDDRTTTPELGAESEAPPIIVIGVDGLSVDGVRNAHAPRLRGLMTRSAWTLKARAVMPTLSSPNWASAIDGGWGSAAYYSAVEEADRHIGAPLDMVGEAALDSTFVLVTSDHGGKGYGHGKNSLAEIQIPWILTGPGVAVGEIAAAVYTFDTAATIAWLLRLDAPECWIGRPVLTAFQPSLTLARANGRVESLRGYCAPLGALVGSVEPGNHR